MNPLLKKHPVEVQVEAQKEVLRDMYRRSLYQTTKHLLGYRDVTWRTHGEVFQALEAPTDRKLIVLPRGCFKSSICSVSYPIWCLLRDPNERILIDSEVYENAKNFLREIKAHLESERVTSLFGPFKCPPRPDKSMPPWNEGELTIRQRTAIKKEASITASGIGAGKTGQHYDRIISDDLNSPKNSSTPEMREKVLDHYRYNQAILEPLGTMLIVGTRYAASDVPGFILENEIGVTP